MAYSGFLLKIGEYTVPFKFLKADSYSVGVKMQDIDAWTDADGYLHREAVELKVVKVEFETPNIITDRKLEEFLSNVRENYIIPKARECLITAYVPEYDEYVTQRAYLADFTPTIYYADENTIKYNPIRFAFIGGVYDG